MLHRWEHNITNLRILQEGLGRDFFLIEKRSSARTSSYFISSHTHG